LNRTLKLGLDASFMMTFDEGYTLKYPIGAEKAGFDYLWMGDHFLPWHDSFQHSFFVWEVLAAIAARTKKITVGPDVTVPIGARYHPAIIAQAGATMEKMYPGRFALGLGSGEAMNERRFLESFPPWEERMERLIEAAELIRRLWTERDYFDFDGKYFKMKMVMYHLRPAHPPPIYFSAIGKKSAFLAGTCADRLMTAATVDRCRDVIFPQFDAGARSVGSDPKKKERAVLCNFATGPVDKIVARVRKLIAGANISRNFNEMDPRKIEASAETLSDSQILDTMYVFQNADEVIDVLSRYQKIGTDQVIISEMSADPERAMRIYSRQVIPYFKTKG